MYQGGHFMGIIFHSGRPNFPLDETELEKRLAKVHELINKPHANIEFVETAFKLMEDCDLITETNVQFLCSAESCKKFNAKFRFPRNKQEGALHYVNAKKYYLPRFYAGDDRLINLNGKKNYLISNDWYKDNNTVPNKRAFYNWLVKKAWESCKIFWQENNKNIQN